MHRIEWEHIVGKTLLQTSGNKTDETIQETSPGVGGFFMGGYTYTVISVADPGPGSGAYLTPGSGMGKKS